MGYHQRSSAKERGHGVVGNRSGETRLDRPLPYGFAQ